MRRCLSRPTKKSLRLAAWAWYLAKASKPGAPRKCEEWYGDCSRCFQGTADREQQRTFRCPVIPEREWAAPDQSWAVYMGGEGEHGESDCDGCPGGWYRTPFALSFERYRRGTHDSPYLKGCTDRLVFDAIHYYESEQARHAETLH